MKPRLQTSLGQHLALTPQLRQALALLQMSVLELEQELAAAVESNPLLDWAAPEPSALTGEEPVLPAETTFSEQPEGTESAHVPAPDEIEFPDLSPWETGPPAYNTTQGHDVPGDDIGQRAISIQLAEDISPQQTLQTWSRQQRQGRSAVGGRCDLRVVKLAISSCRPFHSTTRAGWPHHAKCAPSASVASLGRVVE